MIDGGTKRHEKKEEKTQKVKKIGQIV